MAELKTSAQSDEAARSRAASLIGRVISQRYRIDEVIAMGGMGAVYRGEHVRMRKRVAIKILHPDTEGLPELVKRFEREAVAGAHIQHPNVATATDFGETDDGLFYLISEYVRGVTLHDIIRRGPLAPARAANIARQLAAALAAVHAIDIVHRDLKPRNVMVVEGQNDLVKLIDFGFAKVQLERLSLVSAEMERSERMSIPERLTSAGVVFGTMSYLAPEAAFGMDAVDARSDLFALGIILYEMLAGQHPFSADDPVQLFTKMSTLAPPPISERSPGVVVPPELEAVTRRLTQKFPEERFQSAAELVEALVGACEAAALSLPVPPTTSTRPPPATSAKTPSMPPPPALPKLDTAGEALLTPLPAPPVVAEAAPEAEATAPEASAAAPEAEAAAPEAEAAAPEAEAAAPEASVAALEVNVAAPEPSEAASEEEAAGPDQDAPARPRKKKKRKRKAVEAQDDAPAEAAERAEPEKAPAPAKAAPAAPRRSFGPWLIGVALAAGIGVLIARSGDAPPEPAAPPRPSAAVTPTVPPGTSAAVIPASARPEPPAPPASASAAPSAAPKAEPDLETREALKKAVKGRTWDEAADALLRLAERDPAALDDRGVADAARALAIAVASPPGIARADAVYDALATRFGVAGPDLLYRLVETRGRSGPAIRAADLLRKPEVAAVAAPALRVSFSLRDVPCDKKLNHLDQAVQDGDERTVTVLETVVRACFKHNQAVFDATKKLKQRLKEQ